jgi:alpha-beta hydrolase superfamily lysophospholipase
LPLSRLGATLLAAAALVTLAACGSQGGDDSRGPAATPIERACGDPPAGLYVRTLWLHTSDGVRLYAATAGDGPKAVVLLHQSPANLCGWLPTMKLLSDHGIRALAIDSRGYGQSQSPRTAIFLRYAPDLQAAVDEARAEGSEHVLLMGASLGGAAAMTYAPDLSHVDGVISLSGELNLSDWKLNAIAAVPRLRMPLLVVAGRQDPSLNAAEARQLIDRAGSADKQVAVFPSTYHGWDLLDVAPYRARVRRLVLHWINEH